MPTAAHFLNHFLQANQCENPRHAEVWPWVKGGLAWPKQAFPDCFPAPFLAVPLFFPCVFPVFFLVPSIVFHRFPMALACFTMRSLLLAQLIKYILELSLVDLRMIRHRASHLVAAACLLSNELFGRSCAWPEHMARGCRATEAELRVCCEELRALLRQAPSQQLQARSVWALRSEGSESLGCDNMLYLMSDVMYSAIIQSKDPDYGTFRGRRR